MLILAENITPRLLYIARTLFGDGCVVTTDMTEFENTYTKKITYANQKIFSDSLWIKPYGLLEETSIKQQQTECFGWNNLKVFFKTDGDIPFDILSAAFYLLSRYEEYFTGYKTDGFGNYHHENSLAFKEGFLNLPLINLWLNQLKNQYKFLIPNSQFHITPTYDIDIAFAYKHHPLSKNSGGFAKDILLQRGTFIERFKSLTNSINDPYNVFAWLKNLHLKSNLKPVYFFHVAKQRSKYDKNVLRESKGMVSLINSISKTNSTGIHPSYSSNNNEGILKDEINYLEKITHQKVSKSRQHFLQLQFPKTYETLINNGIKEDYTLGYGTHNGFRASYCKSFFWYNLKEEKQTTLLLHPFCYMDSNSIFEQKLSADKALEEMLYYYKTVKDVDGEFIYIMHNHFLAEQKNWQEWRKCYKDFITQDLNSGL